MLLIGTTHSSLWTFHTGTTEISHLKLSLGDIQYVSKVTFLLYCRVILLPVIMEGVGLYWLIASSSQSSCLQSITIVSNYGYLRTTKYFHSNYGKQTVCNDLFIHKLVIWFLWHECTDDMILHIVYHLFPIASLLWCESCLMQMLPLVHY